MIATSAIVTRPGGGARLRQPSPVKIKGVQFQRLAADTITSFYATWDWTGFIKPQIDRLAAAGANTIKWASGTATVANGNMSQSDLNNKMGQMVAYAGSLGLGVYWSLSDQYDIDDHTLESHKVVSLACARYLSEFPNVIGFDMWNEGLTFSTSTCLTYVAEMYPRLRGVTSLPLTASTGTGPASAMANLRQVAPYVDFYDFHPYDVLDGLGQPTSSVWDALRSDACWKPWIVGEVGVPFSFTDAKRQNGWTTIGALGNAFDCMGSVMYSSQDGTVSTGSYAMLYDASTPPVVRAPLATAFATFPAQL